MRLEVWSFRMEGDESEKRREAEGLERVDVGCAGFSDFLGANFEWFVSLLALGHRTKMRINSRLSLNPR